MGAAFGDAAAGGTGCALGACVATVADVASAGAVDGVDGNVVAGVAVGAVVGSGAAGSWVGLNACALGVA